MKMGWFEVRRTHSEYNEEVKRIDEQIFKLIKQRKERTGVRRYTPPKDVLENWSKSLQMDIPEMNMFLHSLNHDVLREFPDETGELKSVIPVMKKAQDKQCDYVITHTMQHENASVVFVEIRYRDENEGFMHLVPHLMLEVFGEEIAYSVRNHGASGGGLNAQLQFLVSPPLPQNVDDLKFSLVPHTPRFSHKPKELVLDGQVDFD